MLKPATLPHVRYPSVLSIAIGNVSLDEWGECLQTLCREWFPTTLLWYSTFQFQRCWSCWRHSLSSSVHIRHHYFIQSWVYLFTAVSCPRCVYSNLEKDTQWRQKSWIMIHALTKDVKQKFRWSLHYNQKCLGGTKKNGLGAGQIVGPLCTEQKNVNPCSEKKNEWDSSVTIHGL